MTVAPPPQRTAQQPAPPGTHPAPRVPGAGDGRRLRVPRWKLPLHGTDRDVLWLYLLTRIGLWVTSYSVAWLFPSNGDAKDAPSALSRWAQWDWTHFLHIAQAGYFPEGAGPGTPDWDNREAFFPGFPLVLRAVHTVVPDWTLAGLLISFVSGAVAVLALARIARLHLPGEHTAPGPVQRSGSSDSPSPAGRRAVLFLLLSPCAVFLAAGYTEALFLAFALPAWLAAQRHQWAMAGLLTALATCVRISGLFVAAAIGVHFLITAWRARSARAWRPLPWTLLPALPALLYSAYLHAHTGDWMAWKHAQERGWYRQFHAPWESWATTWRAAFDGAYPTGYAYMWQAELLAMVVGLVLLGVLVWLRRWPEAVYLALSLWALGTSYWFTSVPRATLLWWPLWTLLAAWSVRSPRVKSAYVMVVAPLMMVFAVSYLSGRWTG
ncbi:mannosyltransferase family protein [Streptomyces sp. CA-294286]|uniref:mannosyltransferase family protein n=1 Tax=Streptomyces sp. CA-294286 TaxID=3240070 RepID=UPI003D8BD968